MRGGGEGGETFDEGDDTADSFCRLDMMEEVRHFFFFPGAYQDTPAGFFQQVADGFGLGQIEEGVAPEVLGEMDHSGVNGPAAVLVEIDIIVSPVVGEHAAHEDDIAGLKAFDVIAHELRAAALVENDQLHFRMVMPAVVDEGVPVFPYAKRLGRGPWYF